MYLIYRRDDTVKIAYPQAQGHTAGPQAWAIVNKQMQQFANKPTRLLFLAKF
eukprot:Pgem_evm1s20020